MSTIKNITKSNAHQIKPKQNSLTYTSLEKIWDRFSARLVNRSTKRKKSKEVQIKTNVSIFENN